jgi:hypothetical protein
MIVQEGQSKIRQGRLIDGEADIRKALLSRLKLVGKYHVSTARTTIALSQALNEQTRFAEAEQLARRRCRRLLRHKATGVSFVPTFMTGDFVACQ